MKNRKRLFISMMALIVCLIAGAVVIFAMTKGNEESQDETEAETTTYGQHSVEIYTTEEGETTISDKELIAMLEASIESYEEYIDSLKKETEKATEKTTEDETESDTLEQTEESLETETTIEETTEETMDSESIEAEIASMEALIEILQAEKDQLQFQNLNANSAIADLNAQLYAYIGANANQNEVINNLKIQVNALNEQLAAAIRDNANAIAAASSAIAEASSAVVAATTAAPPAAGGNSSQTSGDGTGFKYLAIGNSITLHPICEYWWSFCGMAATSPEKDYFHLVKAHLQEKYGKISTETFNYAVWEYQGHDRSETFYVLDSHLSSDLNLVTIQMGENATSLATFQNDMVGLINHIKSVAPNAQIILVDDIWEYGGRSGMKAAAASATGVGFANLSGIRDKAEYQIGLGTTVYDEAGNPHVIEHAGVAAHPNDAAMAYIANSIIGLLN